MGAAAFLILCGGSAIGSSTFPLIMVLGFVWVLARSERDCGRH
jgi:hypothetical protein